MTYAPSDQPADGPAAEGPPAVAKRRSLGCAFEIVETLVLTVVIYLLIHNFIAQPFEVEQDSMKPTIDPRQYVLIDKLTPRFNSYQRGDIVVFQPPPDFQQGGVPFIKRVIGLPGDTVRLENGRVFVTPPNGVEVQLQEPYVVPAIDGQPAATLPRDPQGTTQWKVAAGTYFVMGDNRPVSEDSRRFGPITQGLIIGRAWLRYFPIDRIGVLARPSYPGLSATAGTGTGRSATARTVPAYLGGSTATIQLSMARS